MMRRGMGTHFDPHLLAFFLANYEQLRAISLANPDETVSDDLINDLLIPGSNDSVLVEFVIP